MLPRLWGSLKRWRTLGLGPMALAYKFERSVPVTSNSRSRVTLASRQHRAWESGPRNVSPAVDGPGSGGELAVIVGVGPGFGYELARRLAREGMAVVMASRNALRLDGLVGEIEAEGGTAFAYGCDATREDSVEELFAHVAAVHGVPNLVVYSLQWTTSDAVVDIEVPAFELAWKHNCLGSFLVARQAARAMVGLKRGTILLVGSTSSMIGRENHLNLAVGKFGQRALSQVMARELWPHGLHVSHLVVDADVRDDDNHDEAVPQAEASHIADSVLLLHRQKSTAWTSEMDIRPSNERFWEHC